jgi:hypothetical protein
VSPTASVLAAWTLTRILVVVIVLAATNLFPQPSVCPDVCHPSTNPLLDALARWDAGAYLSIARDGYPPGSTNPAYFPLYPFLMRVLAAPFGGGDDAKLAAGVLISNGALLIAGLYLVRLVAIDRDAATGSRAAVYLLVFPTSVFLAAVYPESLYLALAVAAIYHARRREWLLAGALAAVAALTRPFGAVIALPLAMEALRRPVAFRGLASTLLAPATFVAWIAVLWLITGDPRALLTAQSRWGGQPGLSLKAFADLLDPAVYGFPFLVVAFTILIGVLVAISWRVLRSSLAAYATVAFLVGISTGSLTSAPRYYLAVFPAFIALAVIAPAWLARAYVALGAGIGTLLTAMFALWFWIG